jgi:hypothetical protein
MAGIGKYIGEGSFTMDNPYGKNEKTTSNGVTANGKGKKGKGKKGKGGYGK